MQTLPLAATVYLVFVCIAAAITSVIACAGSLPPGASNSFWELAVLVGLCAGLGWRSIDLNIGTQKRESVSMSLSFVLVFCGLLRFGAIGAMLTGAAVVLTSSVSERRHWYQTLFNAAVGCLQGVLASWVFLRVNHGTLAFDSVAVLPALVAASLTFYFVNTGLVAIIIALSSGAALWKVWKDNFLWIGPGYFVGAAFSAGAVWVFASGYVPLTILCLIPVILLTYFAVMGYVRRTIELARSQEQLAGMYAATTRSLALAVDAKDHYTHQHILRVQTYSVAVARHMGLSGGELQAVETGALLHDIGKMGIPESILLKPGRLTADEYEIIKQHPQIGAEILAPVPFPYPVIPIVKYHHERWDGGGYPEGLAGENIPFTARILAVADVYDALTTMRAYRAAWSHEDACREICLQSGRHFDPQVVDAFLEVIDAVRAQGAVAPMPPIEISPSAMPPRTEPILDSPLAPVPARETHPLAR